MNIQNVFQGCFDAGNQNSDRNAVVSPAELELELPEVGVRNSRSLREVYYGERNGNQQVLTGISMPIEAVEGRLQMQNRVVQSGPNILTQLSEFVGTKINAFCTMLEENQARHQARVQRESSAKDLCKAFETWADCILDDDLEGDQLLGALDPFQEAAEKFEAAMTRIASDNQKLHESLMQTFRAKSKAVERLLTNELDGE